jgi:flagellar hook protein FlgE
MGDLQIQTNQSAPSATTSAQTIFNLPANASQPANATFDPADASSYNNATSVTVYDSLGAAHTSTMYFVKTATANQWQTRLYVDGTAVGSGGNPAATPPVLPTFTQTLTYSPSGALTTPAGGQVNFGTYTPTTGANPLNIDFDFSKTSQYGNSFGVTSVSQDGFTTGQLTGITVDPTGVVQANFTNGQSTSLGQVALVNFASPQSLQKVDGTNWVETFSSGQPVLGSSGASGFGSLQSGAVEASNVDVTKQLVNMIVAQRNYQANAQMISTEKSITETIINMAR